MEKQGAEPEQSLLICADSTMHLKAYSFNKGENKGGKEREGKNQGKIIRKGRMLLTKANLLKAKASTYKSTPLYTVFTRGDAVIK